MPYTDFHYTPTGTGVISGKEVLEQTEDAINDLGGQISGDVQTAIDTANNALNVANTASSDAQNAVNTANTAYTTATNAQNTANTAQNTASNALTAAQNAQNDVNALGNRVTTAENNITQNTTDISGLTTRMGTAEGNITTLQNDVVTAQGTATSAQNTATMARQQAYVLRYSSTAITDNSTIAFSTLDNTDNIKSGDKVIDSDGKIFSIVSVDTANQTVTVGSALTDLALDANVVHTNRNDDVSIPLNSTSAELGVTGGSTNITFSDKNGKNLSGLTLGNYRSSKRSYARLNIFDKDTNNNEIQDTLEYAYVSNNNNAYLRVSRDNFCALGTTSCRWKGVYAQSYYYGSDSVEFSTKFVTTDTNQTISGNKTFSSTPFIYNSDTSGTTPNLYFRNQLVTKGDTSSSGNQLIRFADTNDKMLGRIQSAKVTNGNTTLNLRADTIDANNADVTAEVQVIAQIDGNKSFSPQADNAVDLGRTLAKWRNLLVNQINGLTPSSLSMPSGNVSDVIDISSYITDLSGNVNNYTAPVNGWISITMNGCSGIQAYINGLWGNQIVRPSVGTVRFLMPVVKNLTVNILVFGGAIDNARFIPCQGNV